MKKQSHYLETELYGLLCVDQTMCKYYVYGLWREKLIFKKKQSSYPYKELWTVIATVELGRDFSGWYIWQSEDFWIYLDLSFELCVII